MSENEEVKEDPKTEEVAAAPAELKLPKLFGFKKGMTAIFTDEGKRIPVTVMECKPWVVTEIKTSEKHGYDAVQVAYGAKKAKSSNKAEVGNLKPLGIQTGFKFKKEVRGKAPEECELGKQVSLNSFEVGQKVQITSKSKGRGFTGVMKRYGFGGGPASHGSGFHRRPGSMGNCTFPGRIMRGKKMPGQYGNKNITVKGVEVVAILPEENTILLKGSVPGPVNGLVAMNLR